MSEDEGNGFPWSVGLFDAHCHPTDTMDSIKEIPTMNTSALTIMATRAQDQQLVVEVATELGTPHADTEDGNWRGVVPSFGWHPWFSHQIYDDAGIVTSAETSLSEEAKMAHYQRVLIPCPGDPSFLRGLPSPRALSTFLNETRERLSRFPSALIGEVGLDKAFRIPQAWLPEEHSDRDQSLTPGGREGRRLSPYRVSMDHQRKILKAQLLLAGEMQRAVSCHGVQAHGVLFQTIEELWKGHERPSNTQRKKQGLAQEAQAHPFDAENTNKSGQTAYRPSFPPRLCLHSYSGPAENLKQYLRAQVPMDVYVSFSIAINFSTAAASKTEDVIRYVPNDRILVESDLHTAGKQMEANLEAISRKVCELKGWGLEAGVKQLNHNWRSFIFGPHKE